MLYRDLLEILEDLSEEQLSEEVIIESEIIGETSDIEFDSKSSRFLAFE